MRFISRVRLDNQAGQYRLDAGPLGLEWAYELYKIAFGAKFALDKELGVAYLHLNFGPFQFALGLKYRKQAPPAT